MKLENYILNVLIKDLKEYESYIVGEALLRYLLGKPIEEYEVITSAPLFSMHKGKLTSENTMVITEYPKKIRIHFKTSKEEYFKRCYFTYETLLWTTSLDIQDQFHAILDIQHQKIQTMNLPKDINRIMEVIYLKEYLHFTFDEQFEGWILAHPFQDSSYDKKRFFAAFQKTIVLDEASSILLRYQKFFSTFLPISSQALEVMRYTKCDFILRMMAFLYEASPSSLIDFFLLYPIDSCTFERIEKVLTYKNYSLHYENLEEFSKLLGNNISLWFSLKRAEALAMKKIELIDKYDLLENQILF